MMIDTKSYRQFSKLKLFLEMTPYQNLKYLHSKCLPLAKIEATNYVPFVVAIAE